jgi:uncharacterized protein (DUF433 family)
MAAVSLSISKEPLATDTDGIVRVGATRVTLDTVVVAFDEGATPEEIVQQYPSLDLADVYAAISYYLRHRSEVEEYLRGRQAQHDDARREIETRSPQAGIRARLVSRRKH